MCLTGTSVWREGGSGGQGTLCPAGAISPLPPLPHPRSPGFWDMHVTGSNSPCVPATVGASQILRGEVCAWGGSVSPLVKFTWHFGTLGRCRRAPQPRTGSLLGFVLACTCPSGNFRELAEHVIKVRSVLGKVRLGLESKCHQGLGAGLEHCPRLLACGVGPLARPTPVQGPAGVSSPALRGSPPTSSQQRPDASPHPILICY